jgi:ABC exporter DevB family membrane fusion protein
MIRKLTFSVLVILFMAAVVVGFNGWKQRRADPTVPVVTGTISRVVVATGRVAPVTEIIIANKIPGRVKAVLAKEGDAVSVGQPLIRFDDEEYVTQVHMARTRIATAEAEVRRAQRGFEASRAQWVEAKSGPRPQEVERARAEIQEAQQRRRNAETERLRLKKLVDDGLIARSQYETGETEAEVTKARARGAEEALSLLLAGPKPETVDTFWALVQEAEASLRRADRQVTQAQAELEYARAVQKTTVVQATVNGKVIRKLVEPGEAVDIGIPLMIIGDVQKTIVKAEVDETDVGKLSLGQAVEITADAYPGRVFPGEVIEIGQAVGKRKIRPEDPVKIQDMKVLETKVEVLQGGADLKLGMTVDVKIIAAEKKNVLLIPKLLVSPGSLEAMVRVRGPQGVESRSISLGLRDDDMVEVTRGLRAGELVVVPVRSR